MHVALGEEFVNFARIGMRERDERLFGAAQVERRFMFAHCLLQAFDAAIHIRIEEGEKAAEVIGIAFMWRGSHQEKMVRHLRQIFAQPIGICFVVL